MATSFLVKINSVGGFVSDGWSIYDFLKNLDKEKPVTTFTDKAFSIASVIFMAGSTRIMPNNGENTFMVHLPWMEVVGDSVTIGEHLKELQNVENQLVNFYSDELSIDKNTILSLLQKETYLSANQCLDFGICNALEEPFKAVAKLNNKEENNESLMNKLSKKIDAIWNKLNGIKAELVLQDATGVDLVFPDLEPTDVVEVDAKVNVDAKPAEGEFLMPDGSTVVAQKGIVTEIKTVEEPIEEEAENVESEEAIENADEIPADPAEKDKMIEDLQAKVEELQGKLDEMMTASQSDKLIDMLSESIEKQAELETKFQALAKSVGSDFTADIKKENKPALTAKEAGVNRVQEILNSRT